MTNPDDSWLDALGEAFTHAKANAALEKARKDAQAAFERYRIERRDQRGQSE